MCLFDTVVKLLLTEVKSNDDAAQCLRAILAHCAQHQCVVTRSLKKSLRKFLLAYRVNISDYSATVLARVLHAEYNSKFGWGPVSEDGVVGSISGLPLTVEGRAEYHARFHGWYTLLYQLILVILMTLAGQSVTSVDVHDMWSSAANATMPWCPAARKDARRALISLPYSSLIVVEKEKDDVLLAMMLAMIASA